MSYNNIVLFSCLFGSVYLCSVSLRIINKALMTYNKKFITTSLLLNSPVFIFSSYIVVYCFTTIKMNIKYEI